MGGQERRGALQQVGRVPFTALQRQQIHVAPGEPPDVGSFFGVTPPLKKKVTPKNDPKKTRAGMGLDGTGRNCFVQVYQ